MSKKCEECVYPRDDDIGSAINYLTGKVKVATTPYQRIKIQKKITVDQVKEVIKSDYGDKLCDGWEEIVEKKFARFKELIEKVPFG